jgi:hypothetical protein
MSTVGFGAYQIYSFNNMQFNSCGNDSMTAQEFKSACESLKRNEILNVNDILVYGNILSENCEQGLCEISLEGGSGLFCDICVIEYVESNRKIITSTWIFGDD